jgi:DNA-directed RNA polymerase specialized sigma24 family protein
MLSRRSLATSHTGAWKASATPGRPSARPVIRGRAVQDAWVRFSQSYAGGAGNLGGFLTTIVARVCLNTLRARKTRREDPAGAHVPDPVVSGEDGADPETEALLADSVGLALVVVLDTGPAA